jgi:hypothetical protein
MWVHLVRATTGQVLHTLECRLPSIVALDTLNSAGKAVHGLEFHVYISGWNHSGPAMYGDEKLLVTLSTSGGPCASFEDTITLGTVRPGTGLKRSKRSKTSATGFAKVEFLCTKEGATLAEFSVDFRRSDAAMREVFACAIEQARWEIKQLESAINEQKKAIERVGQAMQVEQQESEGQSSTE